MVRNLNISGRQPNPRPGSQPATGGRGWRGRGAQSNPANRFEALRLDVIDPPDTDSGADAIAIDEQTDAMGRRVRTQVLADHAKTIINRVDSPDMPFKWTINPYRGCEHGCVYCYARPTHETLGYSSGLDFETKLLAKLDAARLLRKELASPRWAPDGVAEPIVMSGVTDPYQPIEARANITGQVLRVLAEARQPVSIVTKSRLILRDLDLLRELARFNAVRVAVSVTTLDNDLAARMEPRAAAPKTRLWTIQRLASAGIPVSAMIAPVVPGITDREVPRLLKAAADAGATAANCILLRLPHQNKQLFDDWLAEHYPQRRQHVMNLLRQTRGGELYDATFGTRLRGEGPYARQLNQTFDMFRRRWGLAESPPPMNATHFRRPDAREQLALFGAA